MNHTSNVGTCSTFAVLHDIREMRMGQSVTRLCLRQKKKKKKKNRAERNRSLEQCKRSGSVTTFCSDFVFLVSRDSDQFAAFILLVLFFRRRSDRKTSGGKCVAIQRDRNARRPDARDGFNGFSPLICCSPVRVHYCANRRADCGKKVDNGGIVA